ncbi:MAG: TolC family protein [Methylococcaceae bacterium]|nr:TolC family protein [Methylococcaceae bacterium]MDP3903435.1 TolC family protein [Methylococcaceae bacterium]
MSVNRQLCLALLYLISMPLAHGIDFPDVLQDPLQTLPAVIDNGVILPGDSSPFSCSIQKDFATPLALDEAVDIALCNTPQVKIAWANIKAQASALGEARAAYLPTIIGTVSRLHSHTEYPESKVQSFTTNGTTLHGSLSWRLFDFGGRAANLEAANWMLSQALANQDATFQKALNAVIQAYFDSQASNAALIAKIDIERLAQSTLDSAKNREKRGVSGQGDTLQAATALAKAALDKSRAEGEYRKSLSLLVYALGVPTNTTITLPNITEGGDAQTDENTYNLNAWLENARKNHPAISAAMAQWEAARARIIAARSEGLPTVDFAINGYQNGYPGQSPSPTQTRVATIGVSVTIPLFEGFSRTYKIRGAEAQAEQQEAELVDVEHQTLMEVVKSYADAVSSLNNLKFSSTLLQSAKDALATSQRRYDKGAAEIMEILSTQTALADAKQERIRCIAEWRSAKLRILASSGLLGQSMIRKMENGKL